MATLNRLPNAFAAVKAVDDKKKDQTAQLKPVLNRFATLAGVEVARVMEVRSLRFDAQP